MDRKLETYGLAWLSVSFPTSAAIESQTLRDVVSTGERLVVGRVLMTSFELLDLVMLEECRPLHFPIRWPNKCFYIFLKNLLG